MAEPPFEFKIIRFETVEREHLDISIELISQMGNVFVGTIEEFEHYYDTEDGQLFEMKTEDNYLVGAIFLISKANRRISTEIAIRDPGVLEKWIYQMTRECFRLIMNTNIKCMNCSGDMIPRAIGFGDILRNIFEYSLNTRDMTVDVYSRNPTYDVVTREMPCCLDDILEFDEKLFSIGNRRDFIETCARRSDAIYVVKKENEVTGFGMLSKPVAGKRLFGPVYAADDTSVIDILHCFFNYLKNNPSAEEIVAFIPDESLGQNVLPFQYFRRREPLKMWKRKTYREYDVGRDKVVSMGSLLFDIY